MIIINDTYQQISIIHYANDTVCGIFTLYAGGDNKYGTFREISPFCSPE